jgi:membrane protein implicated in regulation of membrane protease activity
MSGLVGAAAIAAEVDPTVQPVRASFYVFVFLAVMLAILLFSFVRHLRRAQGNLGSAKVPPAGSAQASPTGGPTDDVR